MTKGKQRICLKIYKKLVLTQEFTSNTGKILKFCKLNDVPSLRLDVYRRIRRLREGNVFTPVCPFFQSGKSGGIFEFFKKVMEFSDSQGKAREF